MIGDAAHTFHSSVAQGHMGLGQQDQPNGWGSKSTRFHRPNVGNCEIIWKLSDVESVRGVATVYDMMLMVVVVLGL